MLEVMEVPAAAVESAIVIGIHGRGSGPRDIAGLAGAIGLPEMRWILPAAPLPMGAGRTWYSRPYTDLSEANRREFEQSKSSLVELARSLRAEAGGRPLFALGFSQGGVLALELAVRSDVRLAGAVVLSGGLYRPDALREKIVDSARPTPVFWAHGKYDSILPVEPARAQVEVLRARGIDVTFREYPVDHTVSNEGIEDAHQFLLQLANPHD